MSKDPEDDPEVIKAKGDAEVRIIEARAKLHPASQFVYTFFDAIGGIVQGIGCLLIILIIVVAAFAPELFKLILH